MVIDNQEVNRRLSKKKLNAKARNIEFNISFDKMKELLTTKVCFYTHTNLVYTYGEDPNKLTIDRVDNTKGYTDDNIVACTLSINNKKANFTIPQIEKFYEHMKTVDGLTDKQVKMIYKGIQKWKKNNEVLNLLNDKVSGEKLSDIEICKRFMHLKESADDHNLEFDMSFRRYKQLLHTRFCYFSRTPLTHINNKPNTLVITRVDNDKGFVDDNVVVCSSDMNKVINIISFDQIKNACKAIKRMEKKK